jgi:hypothetical protein
MERHTYLFPAVILGALMVALWVGGSMGPAAAHSPAATCEVPPRIAHQVPTYQVPRTRPAVSETAYQVPRTHGRDRAVVEIRNGRERRSKALAQAKERRDASLRAAESVSQLR